MTLLGLVLYVGWCFDDLVVWVWLVVCFILCSAGLFGLWFCGECGFWFGLRLCLAVCVRMFLYAGFCCFGGELFCCWVVNVFGFHCFGGVVLRWFCVFLFWWFPVVWFVFDRLFGWCWFILVIRCLRLLLLLWVFIVVMVSAFGCVVFGLCYFVGFGLVCRLVVCFIVVLCFGLFCFVVDYCGCFCFVDFVLFVFLMIRVRCLDVVLVGVCLLFALLCWVL